MVSPFIVPLYLPDGLEFYGKGLCFFTSCLTSKTPTKSLVTWANRWLLTFVVGSVTVCHSSLICCYTATLVFVVVPLDGNWFTSTKCFQTRPIESNDIVCCGRNICVDSHLGDPIAFDFNIVGFGSSATNLVDPSTFSQSWWERFHIPSRLLWI